MMSSLRSRLSSQKRDGPSLPTLSGVQTERARRSLREFTRQAWPVLESAATPFVTGWHIDAISEHLEAITWGHIPGGSILIISIPPGHMKSLLASVSWLAWEWGPQGMAWVRSLNLSYDQDLATRDSRKTKRLMRSPWYQARWGEKFRLTVDQDTRFENDHHGVRIATSTGGMATGERGDRIVFDDPHNVLKAMSDKERVRTLLFFDEALTTRVTDPKRTVTVIVAQRTHHRDLTGHVLHKLAEEVAKGEVIHLCLPGEFEVARRYVAPPRLAPHLKVQADPRTVEGEALWDGKYPAVELLKWKKRLGNHAYAGQVQQRPTPRGGGLFPRDKVEILAAAPANIRWLRYWDLAGTKEEPGKDPDWTAGIKIGFSGEQIIIGDVVRFRENPAETERKIINTASQDGYGVRVGLPQDPGQAGKWQSQYLVGKLRGYTVSTLLESGDKYTRAEPLASQWEVGNVRLVADKPGRLWVTAYLDEFEEFPSGGHDDQVDATSAGFSILLGGGSVQVVKLLGH